jgi:hypothetical protein
MTENCFQEQNNARANLENPPVPRIEKQKAGVTRSLRQENILVKNGCDPRFSP